MVSVAGMLWLTTAMAERSSTKTQLPCFQSRFMSHKQDSVNVGYIMTGFSLALESRCSKDYMQAGSQLLHTSLPVGYFSLANMYH